MKIQQLLEIIQKLDPKKRIKFQNGKGWENKTMAVNAILEHGGTYLFIWACHPHCIKENLIEGQKLIWYNSNQGNYNKIKEYFPDYVEL